MAGANQKLNSQHNVSEFVHLGFYCCFFIISWSTFQWCLHSFFVLQKIQNEYDQLMNEAKIVVQESEIQYTQLIEKLELEKRSKVNCSWNFFFKKKFFEFFCLLIVLWFFFSKGCSPSSNHCSRGETWQNGRVNEIWAWK